MTKKIIKYEICYNCKLEVTSNHNKYCKKCNLNNFSKSNDNRFFSYEFNKDIAKVKASISKDMKLSTIENFKVNPIEKSIFSKLRFTRFNNLDHFAQYIVHSNEVPFSQLIFVMSADLKKLPQIKNIIQCNQSLIPAEQRKSDWVLEFSPIARGIQLLYKPEFWNTLLTLYITKFHPFCPYLNLKTFNPLAVSSQLMTAIYYCGYQYKLDKHEELTNYMEKLAGQCLKKVINKPSISHLQALLIFSNLYQMQGDMELARACQAALTRMTYLLGIHIEKNKQFSRETMLERKLIHRRVAIVNYNLGGNLQIYPAYLIELPKLDPDLYHNLFDFPTESSEILLLDESNKEEYLIALKLSKLTHIFCDTCLYSLHYIPTSNLTIMKKQLDRNLLLLQEAFSNCENSIIKLMVEFPLFTAHIKQFKAELELSFHEILLTLLAEYSTLNPPNVDKIRQRMLNLTHSMSNIIVSVPDFNFFLQYYSYITTLNYLKLINCFSKPEKERIIHNSSLIKNRLKLNYSNFYELNYLILESSLNFTKGSRV